MDSLIRELLGTGGPLGVLVVIVWIFVRDRKESSTEHRAWMEQTLKNNQAWIDRMQSEHIVAREQTRACLERNTLAMDKNTGAMAELAMAVARSKLHE